MMSMMDLDFMLLRGQKGLKYLSVMLLNVKVCGYVDGVSPLSCFFKFRNGFDIVG